MKSFQISEAEIRNFRMQRVRIDNIPYSDGNVKNEKLPTENVIDRLECTLKFDWTSTIGTLLSAKGLGLIKWFSLRVGGTSDVIRVPGKFLQYLHQLYYRQAPHASHPGTTGSGKAVYHFTIPINGSVAEGGGVASLSMLDLSQTSGLLEIKWGNASDVWSAGTNTITNVTFECDVIQSSNPTKTGVPGSTGYPDYLLHLVTTDLEAVTSTVASKKFDLTDNHIFSRVILMTDTDNVAADGILNSVKIKASEATFQELEADKMQYENLSRYGFSQLQTGFYVADLMTPGQWQQMMSFTTDQRFRLDFDLTDPGAGNHTMNIIYDRYIR